MLDVGCGTAAKAGAKLVGKFVNIIFNIKKKFFRVLLDHNVIKNGFFIRCSPYGASSNHASTLTIIAGPAPV